MSSSFTISGTVTLDASQALSSLSQLQSQMASLASGSGMGTVSSGLTNIGSASQTAASQVSDSTDSMTSGLNNVNSATQSTASQVTSSSENIDSSLAGIGTASQSAASEVSSSAENIDSSLQGISATSQSVQSNISASSSGIQSSIGQIQTTTSVAGSTMQSSNMQIASSYQSMSQSITGMTTIGLMSFERLQNAQESLSMAENNVTVAQANMILTLRQYGSGSVQAIKAHEQLINADDSEQNAQRSLNMQWIQMVATIIPSFVQSIPMIVTSMSRIVGANAEATASYTAMASAAAAYVAIATMGIGLIATMASMSAFSASQNNTMNQNNTFNNYGQADVNSAMAYSAGQASFAGQTVP